MNAGQCDEGRRRRKSGSTLKLVCTSCSLAPPKKNVVLKRGEEEKKTFTCVFNGRPAPLRALSTAPAFGPNERVFIILSCIAIYLFICTIDSC